MKDYILKGVKHTVIGILLCLGVFCSSQQPVHASEGAASYYFPGAFASFAVAVAPDPGFQYVNQTLYYHAKVDKAPLTGLVMSLKATAVYNYFGGSYAFNGSVLGGRLQLCAAVPVGYVYTKAGVNIDIPDYYSISVDDDDKAFNIGDSLISGALAWKAGDFSFKITQMVFAPTGAYSTGDLANVGRNYWGFDTSCAATWLSSKTGTEVSVMPGMLFNTENNATDYKTGNEFHMDFVVNQFLSKSFALGAQGYWYKQVTGDSGDGKPDFLGDFKGESYGFGPALFWMPGCTGGKLSVIGKWLFDSHHENRMKGNYGQLVVCRKF
ncbi:MAG TPA: transporter [Deltaproteobacteria bacterium]|nr:transporter [Deltaproteobacteria bacterium]